MEKRVKLEDRGFYRNMRSALMQELEDGGEYTDDDIRRIIDRLILENPDAGRVPLREKIEIRDELFYSVRKLDVLQELIEDPGITEIMVNGYQTIFYEKEGILHRWDHSFISKERLEDVIQSIAGMCNRVVNEQRPIVDARLQDGSRVNVVMDPVALDGPILTIRRFPEDPITMDKLVKTGSLPREAADFLRDLVGARYSILVGGGTSTGKTTFLNALSAYIPPGERIITIEDNAELQIQGIENLVRMETRNANMDGAHEITMRDLIKTALRMRPTRIIVGEVRGAEAGDFLVCLNTGHAGSLGTAHANSVRDMIGRLEMMVLMGADLPVPVIRRQIASGIEILVHLTRDAGGRRMVGEIAEITGMQGDEIGIRSLFVRDRTGNLVRKNALTHTEKMEKYYESIGEKKEGGASA